MVPSVLYLANQSPMRPNTSAFSSGVPFSCQAPLVSNITYFMLASSLVGESFTDTTNGTPGKWTEQARQLVGSSGKLAPTGKEAAQKSGCFLRENTRGGATVPLASWLP
jgi:hypothetical protein